MDSCALQQQIEEKKKLVTVETIHKNLENRIQFASWETRVWTSCTEEGSWVCFLTAWGLGKEENELKEKHASLTQSVQMEESQLEFCVPVLEEHYQKHQKDLETSITVHQQELQELKATLESSRWSYLKRLIGRISTPVSTEYIEWEYPEASKWNR